MGPTVAPAEGSHLLCPSSPPGAAGASSAQPLTRGRGAAALGALRPKLLPGLTGVPGKSHSESDSWATPAWQPSGPRGRRARVPRDPLTGAPRTRLEAPLALPLPSLRLSDPAWWAPTEPKGQ